MIFSQNVHYLSMGQMKVLRRKDMPPFLTVRAIFSWGRRKMTIVFVHFMTHNVIPLPETNAKKYFKMRFPKHLQFFAGEIQNCWLVFYVKITHVIPLQILLNIYHKAHGNLALLKSDWPLSIRNIIKNSFFTDIFRSFNMRNNDPGDSE